LGAGDPRAGDAPYVAGVATLHGAILPVIDLALRLGWEATLADDQHSILVVQIGNRTCGMVVEAVGDLVMIEQSSLLSPPPLGGTGALRFIEGWRRSRTAWCRCSTSRRWPGAR
jgi:purine-binding chemotaxis protein CheW